jgi:UDP-GlcNAc:undecaprenyl-phosphate GlcNAc-1-phosphate transferase
MNLGHGHRRSVLILWTWTALLSGFVLYPTLTGQNPTYLPFGIAALGVVLYTVLHPSVRRRRREGITPPHGIAIGTDALPAPTLTDPDSPSAPTSELSSVEIEQ